VSIHYSWVIIGGYTSFDPLPSLFGVFPTNSGTSVDVRRLSWFSWRFESWATWSFSFWGKSKWYQITSAKVQICANWTWLYSWCSTEVMSCSVRCNHNWASKSCATSSKKKRNSSFPIRPSWHWGMGPIQVLGPFGCCGAPLDAVGLPRSMKSAFRLFVVATCAYCSRKTPSETEAILRNWLLEGFKHSKAPCGSLHFATTSSWHKLICSLDSRKRHSALSLSSIPKMSCRLNQTQ